MTFKEAKEKADSMYSQLSKVNKLSAEKLAFQFKGLVIMPPNISIALKDKITEQILTKGEDAQMTLMELGLFHLPLEIFVNGQLNGTNILVQLDGFLNMAANAE